MSGHGTVSEPQEDLGILKIRAEVVEVGMTKVIQSFWSSYDFVGFFNGG